MQGSGTGSPRRTAIAVGAALVLALVVGGVVALGDGSGEAPSAPVECVEAWNADQEAIAYGIHNFGGHGYTEALVTRMTVAAEPAEGERGLCVVTFPALTLDREPVAAGQILRDDRWTPISQLDGVELTRLAELQAEAAAGSNATLSREGVLAAP
jgi:hypothetical protein